MSRERPPRLAAALIRLVVDSEELAGDLEETFATLAATRGREHARRWYWKEAFAAMLHRIVRAIEHYGVAATFGIAGGAGMIAMSRLRTRGSYLMLLYPAMMIAAAIYVRSNRVMTFRRRFAFALTTFATMTAVMYVFTLMDPRVTSPSVGGHLWRIAFVLALGSIAAAIVAAFSSIKSMPFFIFPCVPVLAFTLLSFSRAQILRVLLKPVLPFAFFVNWRHDGWALAFVGLDLLLWTAVGWLVFRARVSEVAASDPTQQTPPALP
jgi:hypothetical protein